MERINFNDTAVSDILILTLWIRQILNDKNQQKRYSWLYEKM